MGEEKEETKEKHNIKNLLSEIKLEIHQHDWIPGWAAFMDDGELNESSKAHIILNLGSHLCAIQTNDLDRKDLPYMIAENIMHEVIHALEAWADVEFDEDRVEELLEKYNKKYGKSQKE